MQAGAWRKRIGDSAWTYIREVLGDDAGNDDVLADVLTRLYEAGWRGPEKEPTVNPKGTVVFWPGVEDGRVSSLTSAGLARYWEVKGHVFLLLRAGQAARAMAGPLAARFQEFLAGYEEQCHREGVAPLPEYAQAQVFVGGGSGGLDGSAFLRGIQSEVE